MNVRYEKSEAKAGAIFAFGIGLVIVGLVVHVMAAWLFDRFRATMDLENTPLPALAAQKRTQLPRDLRMIPPPVLQENEITDLERLRRDEDLRLNSHGWVDADAGVVHIPIAEAMRLLEDPKTAAAHGIRVEAVSKKGGRR